MRINNNKIEIVKCDNGYVVEYRHDDWFGGKHDFDKKVFLHNDLDSALERIQIVMGSATLKTNE